MHRRHQHLNIPIEIIRTLATVAETGTFSKAGDRLQLSQPAISAQMKRLQVLVGGAVFQKAPGGGIEFTPLGLLVLAHARKLIEANDQILSLGGGRGSIQPIRLGVGLLYATDFLSRWRSLQPAPAVTLLCGRSDEVARAFSEGILDVACVIRSSQLATNFDRGWEEEFVWVRHPDFVLSPGSPVPLVTWPGSPGDSLAITALERGNIPYRIVCASADLESRLAAVEAGLGLLGVSARSIRPPLVLAKEYYLPKLDPLSAGIAVRPGFAMEGLDVLVEALAQLAPKAAPGVTPDRVSKSMRNQRR